MKLQVIKTDKGYVAINNFKNISRGDRYYNLESKMFLDHDYEDLTSLTENDVKIIATDTTFKLEGIPQFELEDNIPCLQTTDKDQQWAYKEGYKAAQSKGCFTEEDIIKAIRFGKDLWKDAENQVKNGAKKQLFVKDFIDSLKQPKKLVAIEVETNSPYFDTEHQEERERNPSEIKLSLTKSEEYPDGLLTIKQYFYENL